MELSISIWYSIIVFQAGWFLLILGHQSSLYLFVLPILFLYLTSEFFSFKSPPTKNIYFVRCITVLIGLGVDWLFASRQLIRFAENTTIPFWLILLWLLFAITYHDCYGWLKNRSAIAGLLGAVAGPGAYWAASRLADVEILSPVYFTLFSSLFWCGLLVCLSNHHSKISSTPKQDRAQ